MRPWSVVCGTGRGGAAFQTPRCGASISAQADGIDGALLRGATATSSSRASLRRCYRFHRHLVVVVVGVVVIVIVIAWQRARERGAPLDISTLAGDRSLAAPPTNGVVAVPLDARRRRLRARTRRAAPRRHGRPSTGEQTHTNGSRGQS